MLLKVSEHNCLGKHKYIPDKSNKKPGLHFRCIIWDLSRSFLLRLAITIFSIILIYTMAQVNVVSLTPLTTRQISRSLILV